MQNKTKEFSIIGHAAAEMRLCWGIESQPRPQNAISEIGRSRYVKAGESIKILANPTILTASL
jgi:hypothetical protein